jgi:hypothetical protein
MPVSQLSQTDWPRLRRAQWGRGRVQRSGRAGYAHHLRARPYNVQFRKAVGTS